MSKFKIGDLVMCEHLSKYYIGKVYDIDSEIYYFISGDFINNWFNEKNVKKVIK